jgi:hypothetical protein
MPMYRERGDVEQLKMVHLANPQNDILNSGIMDAVRFVAKKDFDTEPVGARQAFPTLHTVSKVPVPSK